MTDTADTTPPAATRADCDYCPRSSQGLRVRLVDEDPASKRVAIDHRDCYEQFTDEVVVRMGGIEGAAPAEGWCHLCRQHTMAGRVVGVGFSESTSGGPSKVRCAACCKDPAGAYARIRGHA